MTNSAQINNPADAFRVMIVDADPLMRRALASMISKVEGFLIIRSTGDYNLVMDYLRRESPDLLIIDIVVPWLTGLELAKKILQSIPDLSVYIMSCHDYSQLANHILDLDFSGFISKPVSPNDLVNLLIKHKRSHTPRPSPQLEKIQAMVRGRDFNSFSEQARKIALSLQLETNNNPNLLNERLASLKHTLTGSAASIFNSHEPGLFLPQEDASVLSVVSVVEMYLFLMVDLTFRNNAVKRNELLKKVFPYIEANLNRSLGLNDLVENCFISQGHLSRTFKKNFNISVMEYVHLKKLVLAKAYFLFTEKSVAEVAELTGYNERSYFGKVFKKFEKSTIQQFRQLTVRADTQAAMVMSRSHSTLLNHFGGSSSP
ncbi:MAG: response regulator [Deltaproteobacteria bacterium]|jgi:two-component system response regulator YesN|nr:response regulator [Deltaproteobacteria bacterium]